MAMRKGLGWFLVMLTVVSASVVASATMVTVSINEDAQYTVVREVAIQLVYTGNEIPTQMRVYTTGADDWSEWFDYTDSLNWALLGDDGLKAIEVEARYWVESRTDTTVYGAWRIVANKDEILLDMTPPVLTYSVTPDATEDGWHNGSVSVVFQTNDVTSGLAEAPRDIRFNREGVGQSVTVKAVDKAGNETQITVSGINIDMTPPVLTYSVTPDANENGWYNGPVSVVFQANDADSGIATSPNDLTFDGEGADQSVTVKAVDKAGNETETTIGGINIDIRPPVLKFSVTPAPHENGWYNCPVSVDYTAMDNLSGIAAIEHVSGAEVLATDGGEQIITIQVPDLAGNTSEISVNHINIDSTLPTIAVLLVDSEGVGGANVHDPTAPIDLKAKLDAFGTYDFDSVALGYAFEDAADTPIEGLNIYATILEVGTSGVISVLQHFLFCAFAPAGEFYYFVLPAELISGQVYEIWFEETAGVNTFKTRVIAP